MRSYRLTPQPSPSRRLLQRTLGAIVAIGVVMSGGCAHYGWSHTGARASVETVGVKADDGLAPAQLTRRLIDRLEIAGVDAEWNGAGEPIRCTIVIDALAAGENTAPIATASCDVGGRTVSARAERSATLEDEISPTIRDVNHRSAEAAIDAVATRVAALMAQNEPSEEPRDGR